MNGRTSVETLLSTYPRCRPELPQAQRATYVEDYRFNRDGKRGLPRIVAKLESWMHRRLGDDLSNGRLLDLGAGNLNHVPYLQPGSTYDAVEPFRELWEDSPHRARAGRIYADLEEIPQGVRYDCIFSVAVLEHLTDLPRILARAGVLLETGGSFRAGFPSEGGLLWGLSWRMTTGIEYRLKRGLDYGAIMRHEHVNTDQEILSLLRYFFREVSVDRFPLDSRHLSLYVTAIAREPYLDRCLHFSQPKHPARSVPHE